MLSNTFLSCSSVKGNKLFSAQWKNKRHIYRNGIRRVGYIEKRYRHRYYRRYFSKSRLIIDTDDTFMVVFRHFDIYTFELTYFDFMQITLHAPHLVYSHDIYQLSR